jgi:hypothetical protein
MLFIRYLGEFSSLALTFYYSVQAIPFQYGTSFITNHGAAPSQHNLSIKLELGNIKEIY